MNVLLFDPEEMAGSLLHLTAEDRRAQHLTEVLNLRQGEELRVGMINGDLGTGRVRRFTEGCYDIEVDLSTSPVKGSGIELILALPRPIMLQRILKQATVLGVQRFHLIRSKRVHKSFFQSHVLEPSAIRDLLVQGLEQAGNTMVPEVSIHHRFKPFVEDVVPEMKSSGRLLGHPEAVVSLGGLYRENRIRGDVILAVGPEGGWIDYEVQRFTDQGFTPFSMGQQILHVDTAVVALLSQLQILQELSAQKE